jgi:hypothetical protein
LRQFTIKTQDLVQKRNILWQKRGGSVVDLSGRFCSSTSKRRLAGQRPHRGS